MRIFGQSWRQRFRPRSRIKMPGTRLGRASLLGLALTLSIQPSRAQLGNVVATNFKFVPEWYPPPNQGQMKSLLQGGRAEPLPGGRTRLTDGVSLQTFLESGALQLIASCSDAIQDSNTVNSASHLRAETADGKFSIDGDGFLWQQTNTTLFISSHVHTLVQPELLESMTSGHSANSNASGLI